MANTFDSKNDAQLNHLRFNEAPQIVTPEGSTQTTK